MSELFGDRMREAAVVLRDEEQAVFQKAVDEVAGANLPGPVLLDFARLAFDLDVSEAGRQAFAELFTRRDVEVTDRSRQLAATLAALTLIERFLRPIGRRRRLAPDSLAAIAVIVLANQGRAAVHPDLFSHASYWVSSVSDHLRGAGTLKLKAPPELPDSLSTPAPSGESEEAALPRDINADVNDLREYVATLDEWTRRASVPGRVSAIEEQQGLMWWLESSRPQEEAVASVVSMCDELLAHSRYSPGPPGAQALLARRLGVIAEVPIAVKDLAQAAARAVPKSVADLCVLSGGSWKDQEDSVSAALGASWLYDELQLAALATPDDSE